jgi:hypothetical protein
MIPMQVGEGAAFAHGDALAIEVVVFRDGAATNFIEAVDVVDGNAVRGLFDARTGGTRIVVVEVAFVDGASCCGVTNDDDAPIAKIGWTSVARPPYSLMINLHR